MMLKRLGHSFDSYLTYFFIFAPLITLQKPDTPPAKDQMRSTTQSSGLACANDEEVNDTKRIYYISHTFDCYRLLNN